MKNDKIWTSIRVRRETKNLLDLIVNVENKSYDKLLDKVIRIYLTNEMKKD